MKWIREIFQGANLLTTPGELNEQKYRNGATNWVQNIAGLYLTLLLMDQPSINGMMYFGVEFLSCPEIRCCNPKPFCGKVAISTQGKSHASCHRILNKLDKPTRWSVLVCKIHILPKSSAGLKLRLVMVLYK